MTVRILSPLLAIAGAGFRLSLVLNAVGVEMATSDLDIQAIARAVSLYSLMLKQVAKNLESARDLLRSSAWDTARGIANQSQLVFDEIKDLTAVDQKKDERGHIRAIAVGKRASLLRRARAMYLVGQLEGLKLSLALLGQVVEYGKLIVENQ